MRPALLLTLLTACKPAPKPEETGTDPAETGESGAPAHSGESDDSAETAETGDSAETAETGDSAETAHTGDSAPAGPDCDIGVEGDLHVDEGETVTLQFTCGGEVRPDLTLTLDDLNRDAVFDETAWTLSWETDDNDADAYHLDPEASNGAKLDLTLWVSDAFWDDGNEPVDPEEYELEDGLPVFHLTVSDEINASYDTPATLVYRGETYEIEAQYRGASSYWYPQKSFTLDFSEDAKFDDDDYGWGKAESLVLQTTFDDNLYLRNRFTYWLWGQLDEDNLEIRTFSAVLYLNGEFWGLYQVQERVDEEFFEDRGLSHDGNGYKGIDHDANFYATDVYGAAKSNWYQGYEKFMGTPEDGEEDAYEDLADLVQWAAEASDLEFRSALGEQFVQDEIFDWFILVTFVGGWDSGGKNQIVYHDPESEDPWRFTPWDFNASWGQQWETSRVSADTWSEFTWANNLFYRTLEDPTLSYALWSRYRRALSGPLDAEVLLAQLQSWREEIDPAAQRSWRKWADSYHSYSGWSSSRAAYGDWTTPETEAEYVYGWIEDRWSAVDDQVEAMGY